MKRLIFASMLLAGMATPAWADYYDGLRAFYLGDHAKAAKEWLAAARSGHAGAQFRLGELYAQGQSVPQSFVHAHLWYNRAAARGHNEARMARDALAKQMTRAQLAKAQQLAIRKAQATVTPKRARKPPARAPAAPRQAIPNAAPRIAPADRPWVRSTPAKRPQLAVATQQPQWRGRNTPYYPLGSLDGHWRGKGHGDPGTLCDFPFTIDLTLRGGKGTGFAIGGPFCPLTGTVDEEGTGYFDGFCTFTQAQVKISFGATHAVGGFTGNIEDCWGSLTMARISR